MVKRFFPTRSPRGPTSSVVTFSENSAAPARRLVEAFIAGETTTGIARLDAMEYGLAYPLCGLLGGLRSTFVRFLETGRPNITSPPKDRP
jgi:hypothetical protein